MSAFLTTCSDCGQRYFHILVGKTLYGVCPCKDKR